MIQLPSCGKISLLSAAVHVDLPNEGFLEMHTYIPRGEEHRRDSRKSTSMVLGETYEKTACHSIE